MTVVCVCGFVRKASSPMTDEARNVSFRIGHKARDRIDRYIEDLAQSSGEKISRSAFMADSAVRQAKRILKDAAPAYQDVPDSDRHHTTLSIFLYEDEEALIRRACEMYLGMPVNVRGNGHE